MRWVLCGVAAGLVLTLLVRSSSRLAVATRATVQHGKQHPGYVGGDLSDRATLPRVLSVATPSGEVILLCIGGAGSIRMGTNVVLSMQAFGHTHILILAPSRSDCAAVWAGSWELVAGAVVWASSVWG